ncbi:MAG: acyltransferase [Deltaproteobacteria bacterium]|nr:acyltransferase [Deltaproteobacteria bacterium]
MTERASYPALTSARFAAAVVVVVFHVWRWGVWEAPPIVERFVAAGPIAVTFFFVLSGFLLTLTYTTQESMLTTTKVAFWRARVARVLPVHWLGVLVAFPVALALWKKAGADPQAFGDVVKDGFFSLSLLQAWIPGHELAINPPAWSIGVEALFYALFPFVAPRLATTTKHPAGHPHPGAWPLLGLLWLVSVWPGIGYVLLDPDGLATGGVVVDRGTHAHYLDMLKYHPLVRLPELLMGVVVGGLFQRGLRVSAAGAAAAMAVVVVVVAAGVPYAILHNGLLAPAFAIVIVALASAPSTSILAARPLVRLGESSYALYILHVPLLWWISGIGERRTGTKILEQPAAAAAAVVVVVVVSVFVFMAFEDPLRRRLRGPKA